MQKIDFNYLYCILQSNNMPSYEVSDNKYNIPIAEVIATAPIMNTSQLLATTPIIPPEPPTDNMERFQYVVEKFNISYFFAQQLSHLANYEICILCDDSGSMCNSVKISSDPFVKTQTRWSEAQESLKIITDIASIFDPNGIDIYYLNRPPIRNVYKSEDLYKHKQFSAQPDGFTPLGERIRDILMEKKSCERNLLLIIFTDGQPNNMKLFMDELKNRKPIDKTFISIVACTDDNASIGYLNNLDKKIKNLDVCDDYNSEKVQIQQVQGSKFSFSFGDYIVKILLGSINKIMDRLDEVKLSNQQLTDLKSSEPNIIKKSNCVIS